MSSLLQQLENNEAVLLMYLAGELPAEDQAEVEQLLAGDAGLSSELDRLRQSHADCMGMMDRLDESQRLATAPAVRQAMREVRRWNLARHVPVEPQPQVIEAGRRWWLTYPMGAAAAILLGLMVWWGYDTTPVQPDTGLVSRPGIQFFESPTRSEYLLLAEEQSLVLSRLDMEELLFPFMELMSEETMN